MWVVNVLVWKKKVVGAFEHPPREVTHDRLCLCREAPEHDVGAPLSQKTDGVRIDMGREQSHGTRTARRERALTSEARKPNCGPSAVTDARRVMVMSVDVTKLGLPSR